MHPASLVPYLAGTTFATGFSAFFLTLPAVIAVRRLLARRWAAPLERDAVERNAVLLACVAGALGAVACADAFAIGVVSDPEGMSVTSGILLGFLAPVPLGAVSWMAGELLSGASVRQLRSLSGRAGLTEEHLPLRRLGEPSEVGALCAYLCSKPAGFMTGQTIGIDGGALRGIH